jgi:hypothetical protein
MFMFSLPQHDYKLFCQQSPVEIRINGINREIQLIPKTDQCFAVAWDDATGHQERESLDCHESGSLVQFTCDDGPGSDPADYMIISARS